jgi:hypothetical protein
MAIPLAPVTLVPGVPVPVTLGNVGVIQAVKLSNGTPFDLTISGFGVQGQGIVVAGLEVMLHSEVENSGVLTIVPVNNNNIAGTGVANIVVYLMGEKLPPGNWPVTIPTQTVQAKVSTVTALINDGSAAGTQIVESTPAGDPGSAVSLLNTGVLILGNATHKGSISSDNATFKTDGNGNVTAVGITASGALTVTGASSLNGDATVPNVLNVTNNGVILKSATHTIIDTTGGVDLILNAPSGTVRLRSSNVDKFTMDSSGNCTSNSLNLTGAAGLSALKVAFTTGSFTNVARFTGTGSGTVATGVTNPFSIANDACTLSGSSQTIGMTIASSSVVTTGAGFAWHGTAYN